MAIACVYVAAGAGHATFVSICKRHTHVVGSCVYRLPRIDGQLVAIVAIVALIARVVAGVVVFLFLRVCVCVLRAIAMFFVWRLVVFAGGVVASSAPPLFGNAF